MQWSSNIGDPIVLWIFKTILLLVLFYCGYKISNGKKDLFNKYAIISTIFYSLIEGLRWMRGVDYWHYYQDIATNFKAIGTTSDPEPIYELFCVGFYNSHLPVCFAFVFYSAILFVSFLSVIRHYRELAIWALPLFFIITVGATENHIRQFFAISFILLAFSVWLDKKYILCYCFLCIAPLIHTSSLLLVAVILLLMHINIKLPKRGGLILLIVYIALFFAWDINNLGAFSTWLQTLDVFTGSKYESYVYNADRWFTGEGSIGDVTGGAVATSGFRKYTEFITSSIIIYYGYKFALLNNNYKILYILSCLNLFIQILGGDIELFGRFAEFFLVFVPLTISFIIIEIKPYKTKEKYLIYVILFIIYFIYMFLRYWGTPTITGSGFIWDA